MVRSSLFLGRGAAALIVAFLAAGCFSTEFSEPRGAGGGGGGTVASTGGAPAQDVCDVTLEAPKLTLFFLAEVSEAMNEVFGGQQEGNAQYNAIEEFFFNASNSGIRAAASKWPPSTGDACTAAAFAGDLADVRELPDTRLAQAKVDTGTFTGAPDSQGALAAGHAAAASYATANPDSISDVVLFISSFGGTCADDTPDDVVRKLKAARDAGTRTWIIPGQAFPSAFHEPLAAAGGGKKLSSQRETALAQLPKEARACRYILPPGASSARYGSTDLVEVADGAACEADAKNAYFLNSQGHLELCPATCAAVGLQKPIARVACEKT